MEQIFVPPPPAVVSEDAMTTPALQANDGAPLEPALGSEELPSAGSASHWSGTCRPCTFFYAKGCENGIKCAFCHLCEKGEKKRRKKVRLQQKKMEKRLEEILNEDDEED